MRYIVNASNFDWVCSLDILADSETEAIELLHKVTNAQNIHFENDEVVAHTNEPSEPDYDSAWQDGRFTKFSNHGN